MTTRASERGSGVKYISDLPTVDSLNDRDVFVIDDGNHNYNITWATLKALVGTISSVSAADNGSITFILSNGIELSVTPHDPGKQNTLTFDDTPTAKSKNPVTSNGIFEALKDKLDSQDYSIFKGATQNGAGERGIVPAPAGVSEYLSSDGVWTAPDREPKVNSQKLITSGAVFDALKRLKTGSAVTGRTLSLNIQ